MTTATLKYIRQYQLIFSSVSKSNITFWYRPGLSLYLNNKKILPFPALLTIARLHIKFTMLLTFKLHENSFYHHKISFTLENILKNVSPIMFLNLAHQILFSNKLIKQIFFYNVLFRQLLFPRNIAY